MLIRKGCIGLAGTAGGDDDAVTGSDFTISVASVND